MTLYDPRLSHFDLDFSRGKNGEDRIEHLFRQSEANNKQIEVKSDAWWPITGRFYVEHASYNSG